jgi:magnesium chelatase family protein
MLVAATNPCPCGYAGTTRCRCDERDHARHARRLSGPLLDRVDVMVHVERPTADQLAGPPLRSSAAARDLVAAARERQQVRLRGTGVSCNAHMGAALVRAHARLDSMGERRLRRAYERGHLSARGHQRILRVALSIADLEGASRITDTHVLRAISLRVDWAAHAEATA